MPADRKPPPVVWDALLQTAQRLQQREFDLGLEITSLHDRLFPSFIEQLHLYFLQNFYTKLRTDKQPGWDLVTAKQIGAEDFLTSLTVDFLDTLGEEVDEALDEMTEESTEDGFLTGLWLMRRAGLDLDQGPAWDFPDFGILLGAAAIDGLTAVDRARQWRTLYRNKLLTAFNGLMVTQGTIVETASLTTTLWRTYVRDVTAMAANEVYWGFSVGEHAALSLFADFVDEIWVTQDDEKVCYICAPLHLVRTPLLPIRDSHPACRCKKAPILLADGVPIPVDYATFVASLRSV